MTHSAALPAASAIVFRDVHLVREGRPVFSGLSLSLPERRIGVVGRNGCGKSTLLRLVNGLLMPDRGSVEVDGLQTARDARAIRRRVGLLFQNPESQIVFPTVEDDLAFGLRNHAVASGDIAARVAAVLDELGIAALAGRRVQDLSGGEKQLVALAGVLVMRPRWMLFDEPTASLDLWYRRRLLARLGAMPQQVIVATHDLECLAGFDRVIVLHDAAVACDDVPSVALRYYRERLG